MEDLSETILKLNKKYEMNNCNGYMHDNDCNFDIYLGNYPILLSAPHAVKQMRNMLTKKSDILTGAITEYLCYRENVFGIIRSYNLKDDPNYENKGYGLLYKQAILSLIQEYNILYLIDIHGCSDYFSFDIDIGTNDGKNVLYYDEMISVIYKELSSLGEIGINVKFKASRDTNICKYIHDNAKISCYQLEISHKLRVDKTNRLLCALINMLESMKQKIILEERKKDKQLKLSL